MSEAIKAPNALQDAKAAYDKMMMDYDSYRCYPGSSDEIRSAYLIRYQASLNNYRDLCTVIVERLMRENPAVLEAMHVLYLS